MRPGRSTCACPGRIHADWHHSACSTSRRPGGLGERLSAGGSIRGCFVTGTDTGVGKTVLAAAIVAALRVTGVGVAALKPVITGLDEPADPDWPHDHELLALAAGVPAESVFLSGYGPPVSPHLAAELSGRPLHPRALAGLIRGRAGEHDVLVVEGVGGLLVPLGEGYAVRDLARDLGLPLLIAARPGLGTINHTLLSIESARAAGLSIAAVVLTPWPEAPGVVELSNRKTIAALGEVPVAGLRAIARADAGLLAAAGATLPLEDWL